jgi:methyltransferase (TIGR00027 family)
MMLAAVEHHQAPDKRLIDDDLAELFLPARLRWLVRAARPAPLRRALIAIAERLRPGLWADLVCRRRFVDDKLDAALPDIDAVVVLRAGMNTRAYHVARRARIPVFEVDIPVTIARKATLVRRVLGTLPLSVRLVAMDFERDDLLTALAEHGYHTDYRTFFIAEGSSQYLSASAVATTLEGLRAAAPESQLVFTYIRQDFVGDVNHRGAGSLVRRLRRRPRVWRFGLEPDHVAEFLADYGWHLVEQADSERLARRYVDPTGRDLAASGAEWSGHARKQ